MAKFTARLECDMFAYEVKADISETGVNYLDIYFGDDPLNINQLNHFISVYGEADLDDEVMTQYRREMEANATDKDVEAWEAEQSKGGAA